MRSDRTRPGCDETPAPPPARVALLVLVTLTVANCSSPPRGASRSGSDIDPRYGVRASPRVIADGEPVPKGGGREMVGKPYTVAGRTYVPRDDRNYTREGLASWYGAAFHGRLTANGEVFDRESVAAAHPTLPLPSYARVTNLRNGHSLIVRVNDRGPYHENRLIDVSQRAAEALGFARHGTTRVRVEYVGRASTRGSDDAKLMATLRTDGGRAPYRGQTAPTMVASAEEPPRPPSPPTAGAPLRLAAAEPLSDTDPPSAEETAGTGAAEPAIAASTPLPPERPGAPSLTPRRMRVADGEPAALPGAALSYAAAGTGRSPATR